MMSANGGVVVVMLDIVKFFCIALLVRKSVKLNTWVRVSAILLGGTGSLPSPDTSIATCKKSPPIGVKG